MAFLNSKRLPSVRSILAEFPPLPEKKVEPRREEIRRILEGIDKRFLVLVGPCSFFPIEAGVQHARRIRALQQQVKDVMVLVERVYTEKPRTDNGWEGIKHNPRPDLNGSGGVNVRQGILAARGAMHKVAPMIGIADEILNPDLYEYFNDLLSYGAIGARDATVMRQRRAAGGMEFPMGMKHDMSGKLMTGVKGVVVAQTPGNKLILGMKEVEVSGNPHAHLILRGSEDNGPNWMPEKIEEAAGLLEDAKVQHPALLVDCSHANAIDPELNKRTPDHQIGGRISFESEHSLQCLNEKHSISSHNFLKVNAMKFRF
jgi:3-deoxy-7-phosphoheptulonate synthase